MSDIFGVQFYPTPESTGLKMLEGLELKSGVRVYDPGAGKGDLLNLAIKHAKQYHFDGWSTRSEIKTYAGEIDPKFHPILREQGHQLVAADIFDTPPHQYFDIILMNPPFRQGVAHLVRVFDAIAKG